MKELTIPKNIKVIETDAFRFCNNLGKITFNEGLEKIGARAFDCMGNKRNDLNQLEIRLSKSIKYIGTAAFSPIYKFSPKKSIKLHVYFKGKAPKINKDSFINGEFVDFKKYGRSLVVIHAPKGAKGYNKGAWKHYKVVRY